MLSKTEDHGADNTRRLADPLPCVQNFNSAKTTAVTENKQQKRAKRPQKSTQNNEFCRKTYLLHILGAMLNWEFLPVKGKNSH